MDRREVGTAALFTSGREKPGSRINERWSVRSQGQSRVSKRLDQDKQSCGQGVHLTKRPVIKERYVGPHWPVHRYLSHFHRQGLAVSKHSQDRDTCLDALKGWFGALLGTCQTYITSRAYVARNDIRKVTSDDRGNVILIASSAIP